MRSMSKKPYLLYRGLRQVGETILLRALLRSEAEELEYHPLPWVHHDTALRAEGSLSRLEAIEKVIEAENLKPGVALDIGSHVGFFSLSLAKRGWFVYAVESNRQRLLLSFLIAQRIKANMNPIRLNIDKSNVGCLPMADITLCLSIWHHWVRRYGLEDATFILGEVLNKTKSLLFFDAGENEMDERYGLPYGGEKASEFLWRYLCGFSSLQSVVRLGEHQAFSPGEIRKPVRRTLFCLKKTCADAS